MPTAKIKPLDSYIGFNDYTYELNGKLWVALKPNLDGNYAFKEKEFYLKTTTLTGYIENNNYWLVCNLADSEGMEEGSFSINIRNKEGDKWVPDKEKNIELLKRWQADGSNTAIFVNAVPQLKTLVTCLSQLNIICKNEIQVKLHIDGVLTERLEANLIKFLLYAVEYGKPQPDSDEMKAWLDIKNAGLGVMPILKKENLPLKLIKDEFDEVIGSEPSSFPFEGELPIYSKLLFTPPTVTEKKGGSSGWGSTTNVTVNNNSQPEERLKFIISCMKNAGIELISDDFKGVLFALHGEKANALNAYILAREILSGEAPI